MYGSLSALALTEEALSLQVAQYLSVAFPSVICHFDLSGVNNTSRRSRGINKTLNRQRGYPDLFIAQPINNGLTHYAGLFIELKRDGVRTHNRAGKPADGHVAEQAAMLHELAKRGYIARFAVGFDEAKALIDRYLAGRPLPDDARPVELHEGEAEGPAF